MSKTMENLKTAFTGESEARNRYSFFAEVARKEGYHYIAKIFKNNFKWGFTKPTCQWTKSLPGYF